MSPEPPAQVPRRAWRQATKKNHPYTEIHNKRRVPHTPSLATQQPPVVEAFASCSSLPAVIQRHTNLAINASNGNGQTENKPAKR
jgi:hypothetical protein